MFPLMRHCILPLPLQHCILRWCIKRPLIFLNFVWHYRSRLKWGNIKEGWKQHQKCTTEALHVYRGRLKWGNDSRLKEQNKRWMKIPSEVPEPIIFSTTNKDEPGDQATYLSMKVGQREHMRSGLWVAQGEGGLLIQGPSQGPFAAEGHILKGLPHVEGCLSEGWSTVEGRLRGSHSHIDCKWSACLACHWNCWLISSLCCDPQFDLL